MSNGLCPNCGTPAPVHSSVCDKCGASLGRAFIDLTPTGRDRVALFGTRFTMQGVFYPRRFDRENIALVSPDEAEQEYIHGKYMSELLRGVVLPETHAGLLSIIDAMKARSGIDGVILGGTELSLILREQTAAGLPVLDTTQIHVDAAVAELLG
jgi:aspartate racemase